MCTDEQRAARLPRASAKERARKEQHQQTLVDWLLPADQSPLEDDMAGRFQTALEEEDRHLASLRAWMEQICLNEAGVQ